MQRNYMIYSMELSWLGHFSSLIAKVKSGW